jgi:hypothetical protein
MSLLYRVEVHDGQGWRFGVRMNDNKRLPEFCNLMVADHFVTRNEALKLRNDASRICGGTLRVTSVDDRDHFAPVTAGDGQ